MAIYQTEGIPSKAVLPFKKWFELEVTGLQAYGGKVKNTDGEEESTGKQLVVRVSARVIDYPQRQFVGSRIERTFFLGSKEDPDAELPETRSSRDWVAFKKFMRICDARPTGNTFEDEQSVHGTKFLGFSWQRTRKNQDGTTEPEAYIIDFAKVGTRDLGPVEIDQDAPKPVEN
jgi:hypothetical protein